MLDTLSADNWHKRAVRRVGLRPLRRKPLAAPREFGLQLVGPDVAATLDEKMGNSDDNNTAASPAPAGHLYVYLAVVLVAAAIYLGAFFPRLR